MSKELTYTWRQMFLVSVEKIAGIVIKYTGWNVIDPIIGIVVGLVILYSTWHLLQESLRLALDGVPEGIDVQKVETVLSSGIQMSF